MKKPEAKVIRASRTATARCGKARSRSWVALFAVTGLVGVSGQAAAHDPVFGLGSHVLFRGGYEVHLKATRDQAGDARVGSGGVSLAYGVTGNLTLGAELPYRFARTPGTGSEGLGDASVYGKYRFWRRDRRGVQDSLALLLKLKLNSAAASHGTGSSDTIMGLAYGHESLEWYRWASIRYRHNGRGNAELDRGDAVLLDLVAGWRPRPPVYTRPDLVWMLELNGEMTQFNRVGALRLAGTGGRAWFVSPGLMWTWHNFAVKTGVQLPLVSDLNGARRKDDYRARLEFEWHL